MANTELVTPGTLTGPELDALLGDHWPEMRRTRENAEASNRVIAGDDPFVLPTNFTIAGADQYIASLPHPRTVPARVLQKVIARRPHLSVPLGPKGLGITAQRLTTKVEQPLNAIVEDRNAGFQWQRACALLTYEGFCASITVLDPADWQKRPSAWEDEKSRTWKKRYRVDSRGRDEDHENYSGKVDDTRAKGRHDLDNEVFRARNVPIRHRAVSILQCAPIFDGDYDKVGGLIVSQEFSISSLKRKYRFDEAGLMTATGGNGQDGLGGDGGQGIGSRSGIGQGTLTRLEAWLYDEDGVPYVSYAIKSGHRCVEARWKTDDAYDGELACINLKERFGLDRLPVTWRFGLGNPGEINADMRAMGFTMPFEGGWRSVRTKMTANNVAILFGSYPILIEESDAGTPMLALEDDQAPDTPDIEPLKITRATPGTKLRVLEIHPIDASAFRQIELELGANDDESPGKSNKDQSGFSQSMAEAFEELSLTTIHDGLGELYEDHGSFVLEAAKRFPEEKKVASIMVFRSTDVPVSDSAGEAAHNEPMELDPSLIDETFTCVSQYDRSMSIPEKQQAMEEVARNLRTRRDYLESTGINSPETTELELIAEAQRGTPEFSKYLMTLVAQIQGAEELEEIERAQADGLANEAGLMTGAAQGVAPAVPGELMPLMQGAPGVPEGGASVTGMAAPQYGQNALAGIVGGPAMTGPINNAIAAGGVVPPNLPPPNGV